ncbi:RSP_7527 family protein [uncultured Roseovarius sp.]|uniref:RSP_7527 family protein n=1 Tax=uncultured Roseovarius sp. TaxID=293344 RepID=UPI00345BDE28
MSIERKSTYPTQAEVDQIIARARDMRAECMARWIRSGMSKIASLFSRSRKPSIAS